MIILAEVLSHIDYSFTIPYIHWKRIVLSFPGFTQQRIFYCQQWRIRSSQQRWGLRHAILLRRLLFSCEFCKIFKTNIFIEHLWWLLLQGMDSRSKTKICSSLNNIELCATCPKKILRLSRKIDVKIVKPLQREKCRYSEFSWFVFSCIRTECGKIRTRKTPNTDTFTQCVKRSSCKKSW